MLSPQEATKAAVDFFRSLPPDALERKDEPRLEEISEVSPNEWLVVLSYLSSPRVSAEENENPFARAVRLRRLFKEFLIDATSGKVRAMKNPADA